RLCPAYHTAVVFRTIFGNIANAVNILIPILVQETSHILGAVGGPAPDIDLGVGICNLLGEYVYMTRLHVIGALYMKGIVLGVCPHIDQINLLPVCGVGHSLFPYLVQLEHIYHVVCGDLGGKAIMDSFFIRPKRARCKSKSRSSDYKYLSSIIFSL
ncbi:MAG: hypothetical protein P8Y00_12740, partial [Deltaproteobacteria bacterium]